MKQYYLITKEEYNKLSNDILQLKKIVKDIQDFNFNEINKSKIEINNYMDISLKAMEYNFKKRGDELIISFDSKIKKIIKNKIRYLIKEELNSIILEEELFEKLEKEGILNEKD